MQNQSNCLITFETQLKTALLHKSNHHHHLFERSDALNLLLPVFPFLHRIREIVSSHSSVGLQLVNIYVSVHKTQIRTWPISSHPDRTSLVNKEYKN